MRKVNRATWMRLPRLYAGTRHTNLNITAPRSAYGPVPTSEHKGNYTVGPLLIE